MKELQNGILEDKQNILDQSLEESDCIKYVIKLIDNGIENQNYKIPADDITQLKNGLTSSFKNLFEVKQIIKIDGCFFGCTISKSI